MVALSGKAVALGSPPSSLHQISQVDLGDWMTEIEASLAAGGFSYIRSSLALLQAEAAQPWEYGWVVSTSADAGIYQYQYGAWVKAANLPAVMTESLAAQQAAASRDEARVYRDESLQFATLSDGFQQTGKIYRDQAGASAALALANANAVQVARSQVETVALGAGTEIYATVSAGLAATPSGGVFYVLTDTGVDIYQDQSGVAVAKGSIDTLQSEGLDVRKFGAISGVEGSATTTRVAIAMAIAAANAAGGGRVLVPSGTWWVDSPITLYGANVELLGVGGGAVIRAASSFSGSAIISMNGTGNAVRNLEIDGNGVTSSYVSGVTIAGAASNGCAIEDNRITRCSLNGIAVVDGGTPTGPGAYVHTDTVIRGNRITDVGWVGIQVQGAVRPVVEVNTVSRCGLHGIAILYWTYSAVVARNFVSKASPPTYIYNGVGSLGGIEGGFMIATSAETSDTRVADNVCYDNRNSGQDGIGLGETAGVTHGRMVVTGNIVIYAGLFGIDVCGNATVADNQIYESAQFGIVLTLDKGGTIGPGTVTGNSIVNCNGYAGITIGPPFVSGTLLVADMVIANNVIADYRPTKAMQVGINMVTAPGSTIRNVLVTGNIAMEVAARGFVASGSGSLTNLFQSNNIFLGEPRGDIYLTTMGGWSNASAAAPLKVYSAGDGMAVLSGAVTGGATAPGTVVAVLPAGVRPLASGQFMGSTDLGTVAYVSILTTGQIQIAAGFSAGVTSLNGITFRV